MLRYAFFPRACRSLMKSQPLFSKSVLVRFASTTPSLRIMRRKPQILPAAQTEPLAPVAEISRLDSSRSAKPSGSVHLFEAVTPWYFRRWVWLIVGLNVAWVVFEVDTMLKYFVEKVEHEDGSVTYEKKPLWQRVGASIIVVLGSGCFIGGVLLTRRRNVRVIDLVQRGKAFYVETAADDLGSGKTFERKDCVISPNRSADWMDLHVKGIRAKYSLRLRGAKTLGAPGDPVDVRKGLYAAWYGKGVRAT